MVRLVRRCVTATCVGASHHDYIILGAGSAGSVVTNRIITQSDASVLLLDAGPHGALGGKKSLATNFSDFWKFAMPSALTENLASKYDWQFKTTPQKHLNDRVIDQPRGKVMGGSSNLNAMVYARGHACDFERWNTEVTDGELSWSYADVLPYFKRAQRDATPFPPVPLLGDISALPDMLTYKGSDGPLVVTNGSTFSQAKYPGKPNLLDRSPLFDAFVKAGVACGYNYTPDSNGFMNEGFGPLDQTVTENGERCSTEKAYLSPLLDDSGKPISSQLTLSPNSHVLRILFEGTKAIGVEYLDSKTNQTHKVFANKEVICSLGSIGSPQLLMCSGVGLAQHLEEVGVEVVLDCAEVGSNLQDHLEFYMQYMCKKPVTLYPVGNWLPTPWYRILVGLEWFLGSGKGLAGSNQFETGGFIRTRAGIEHPNIQYHFIPGAVVGQSDFLPFHAFQAHCGTLRPTSRGTLRLRSKDTRHYPLIDPNYLATEEDIVELRDGLRLTDEIIRSAPFDEYRGKALFENDINLTDDASVDDWIRRNSHSAYHPCSTCAMGKVTDSAGRVQGIESLRIIDASIMPSLTSGNLNSPTIMLAEKIVDHVLQRPQLSREEAKWWTHPDWQTKQR